MPPEGNGWEEWRKHILSELKRHNECVEKLDGKVDVLEDKFDNRLDRLREQVKDLSVQVTSNRVKIAMISAVSGLVAGGIMSIIVMLIEHTIP